MEKKIFSIMTYNMHKGFCFYSRKYVVQEVKKAIHEVGAEIVFLQEILGFHPTVKKLDDKITETQFEYIADTIWTNYAYGKNAVYSSGHHGNAILSKYPFIFHENTNISTNRREKRGLLHGKVSFPEEGFELDVLCLHLNLFEGARKKQVKMIIDYVNDRIGKEAPLLIVGDFNDWKNGLCLDLRDSLGLGEAFRNATGKQAKTFPSWFPLVSLDRIYYRGINLLEVQVLDKKPWRSLSDHLALFARFELS